MMSTDVKNTNNKYGVYIRSVKGNGTTEVHTQFTVCSLYYPASLQPCFWIKQHVISWITSPEQ